MHMFLAILTGLLIAIQATSTVPPPAAPAKPSANESKVDQAITVVDEEGKVHSVTADDMAHLPRHKIKAKDHEIEAEFEGVTLVDLLKSQGVAFGKELRGRRAANVVVCEATDGYRVAIALLEIDPETTDRLVLVADRRDGKPLDEKQGPFRLVILDDKRPIRWIRMVRTIRVVNVKDILTDQSQNGTSAQQAK